jgi:hypothetical protein
MFDPAANIIEEETVHLFLCYCTLVNNIKGKKLSIQNVFVATLQEPTLKNIFKDISGVDSDYEVVKIFLEFDPTIVKSKYITKYLNSRKNAH